MRSLLLLILIGLSINSLNAQISCVSLAAYDEVYLQQVSNDNVTYPPGTAFITSGDISYVKPGPNNFYQFIQGDSLLYIGNIDIDVSASSCSDKVLTFSTVYLWGVAVDGDTVFNSPNPLAFYQGNGWTLSQDGQGNFTVTGDFDVVSLYSSTNYLFNVCLECVSEGNCISLAPYNETYLNQVSMDNVTYPPGTAFITSEDISYVKPGPNNFYQFIQGDSLLYIGNIDIDVSASQCTEKVLTFSVIYLIGMAVDGDTIFNSNNPPGSFQGNGWSMAYDGQGNYTVSGDFDVVSLFSSTNFLFNVCLDCAVDQDCISLAAYDQNYLNQVSIDDVTYPPGTAFVTSGDISYVKPSSGNYYQFIQGDSLLYIGDIDIDVSASPCANKVLTFSTVYLLGVAVDGDTVFNNLNPPAFYQGNGWTLSQDGQGNYTVTGDFDVVSLYSSTNYLFNVCLSCGSAGLAEIPAIALSVYPNPAHDLVRVESPTSLNGILELHAASGLLVYSTHFVGTSQVIVVSSLPNGYYYGIMKGSNGSIEPIRFVKQ